LPRQKSRGAPEPNADPLAPLLEGGIVVPEDMLRLMIEHCDADGLERSAAHVAKREISTILETYRRNGIPFDFEEIITEILSGYFRMFRIEGSSTDGRRRVIKLSHKRGPKWSRYLRGYLQSAYRTASKEGVEIQVSDQFVQVSFKAEAQ
jgi:hypothetical protein